MKKLYYRIAGLFNDVCKEVINFNEVGTDFHGCPQKVYELLSENSKTVTIKENYGSGCIQWVGYKNIKDAQQESKKLKDKQKLREIERLEKELKKLKQEA